MFTFAFFFWGPTNPAQQLCDKQGHCTPAKVQAIEHEMGLDVPVTTAYAKFVGSIFHDRKIYYQWEVDCPAPCLGISWSNRQPITGELLKKLPPTIFIALGGGLSFLLLGVGSGLLAAKFRGGWLDRFLMSANLVLWALPEYVVYLLLWIFLTLELHFFPSGAQSLTAHSSPFSWLYALILPWFAIGIVYSGGYARYARSQMVETLSEDYIRSAKAKGVSNNGLMFKHALRAAIVPIVTLFGLDLAGLLAGTIYLENIFGFQGIGAWALKAIQAPFDFPVVTATVLFASVLITVANLIVDILYSVLDPRVRIA